MAYPTVSHELVHGGIPGPIYDILNQCLLETERLRFFTSIAAASADLRSTAHEAPKLSRPILEACFPILSYSDDSSCEAVSWSDSEMQRRLVLDAPFDTNDGRFHPKPPGWSPSDFYPWNETLVTTNRDESLDFPCPHPAEGDSPVAPGDEMLTQVVPRTYIEHLKVMSLLDRYDNILIDKKARRERSANGGGRALTPYRLSGQRYEPCDRIMYEFRELDRWIRLLESPQRGVIHIPTHDASQQPASGTYDTDCVYCPPFVVSDASYRRFFVLTTGFNEQFEYIGLVADIAPTCGSILNVWPLLNHFAFMM